MGGHPDAPADDDEVGIVRVTSGDVCLPWDNGTVKECGRSVMTPRRMRKFIDEDHWLKDFPTKLPL